MSCTEMYAIARNGDVVSYAEFRNSHGGAMAIWTLLGAKYMPDRAFYELMMEGMRPLFTAAKEGVSGRTFEPWEVVTLMTTCDRVMISIEHVESVASAFETFYENYLPQRQGLVFSVSDQARELRRMLSEREEQGWRGVCWNQTSVNGDSLWYGVNEGDDGHRHYNVDRDTSHWFWPET